MRKLLLLFLCLGTISAAHAQNWDTWHYHADISVLPQADDTYDAIYADFTHLLKSTFKASETLDENSIRVVPLQNEKIGEPVAFRFIKRDDYNADSNAAGTLIFLVKGTTENIPVKYRVYFDTIANGKKSAFTNSSDIPSEANMIWNSGFEILSEGYKGTNRYKNAGENMPIGWWGNLRNSGITENLAKSVHSGNHAFGIVTPKGKRNLSLASAPSPPGIRVQPAHSYLFSCWIKGENLTGKYPTTISVYWRGEDGKLVKRDNIDFSLKDAADYDWTQVTQYLAAPDDAASASLYIGTYSQTGLLTIDDLMIRLAIPPLLEVNKTIQ